jgi:peptidoglycan/LPS O-acetylase OafA/YrhL
VLSGYLITSILLREMDVSGRLNLRAFYLRRALRLLPALLFLLVLVNLLALVGRSQLSPYSALRGSLQALFYVTDFVLGFKLEFTPELAHMWTLAVEEQYYLVWPVLVLLLLRRSRGRRLRVLGWMLGISVLLRMLTVSFGMREGWFFYALPTCWFECLLAGAALAVHGFQKGWGWLSHARARRVAIAACWATLLTFAMHPNTFLSPVTYVLGIPLLTASSIGLVACASVEGRGRTKRVMSCRALRWLGERSYGLYLFNSTAILVASQWLGHGLGSRVLGASAAVGLAVISRRLVEEPALRFKGRIGRGPVHRAMVERRPGPQIL